MFDTDPITLWWILTGALVAAEMLTGTFFLLMFAIGAASGALTAHAGASGSFQVAVASVVIIVATTFWHMVIRNRVKRGPSVQANPDVQSDVGQTVHIAEGWFEQTGAKDRVSYRGTTWPAQTVDKTPLEVGSYVIAYVSGTTLILQRA